MESPPPSPSPSPSPSSLNTKIGPKDMQITTIVSIGFIILGVIISIILFQVLPKSQRNSWDFNRILSIFNVSSFFSSINRKLYS